MEWFICDDCGCQFPQSVFNLHCPKCKSENYKLSGVDVIIDTKKSVVNRYNMWKLNEVINKDKEGENND